MQYTTEFGSIENHRPGGVQVINEDPKRFCFSNIFDVAARSKPYERVVVGKNFEYVIEAVRAEGTSPWYTCAHDEFAVAMEGKVTVELFKLANPDSVVDPESEGAHRISGEPVGRKMGTIVLGQGHMALLPVGSAYRFRADAPYCMIIQSILGPESVQKWAEICHTQST